MSEHRPGLGRVPFGTAAAAVTAHLIMHTRQLHDLRARVGAAAGQEE